MATLKSCKASLSDGERISFVDQVLSVLEELKVRLPFFDTPCIYTYIFFSSKYRLVALAWMLLQSLLQRLLNLLAYCCHILVNSENLILAVNQK